MKHNDHGVFGELIHHIEELFEAAEEKQLFRSAQSITGELTGFLNESQHYITLHDIQKLKPVFLNDAMKDYYGFSKNTFQDIDYFYYFTTIHPSAYHTLLDSVLHFKKGGESYLKLEYKLKNGQGKYEKFLGVTKSIFLGSKASFAISLLHKKEKPDNGSFPNNSITKRELEIILMICKGKKTNEISEELFISPETAKVHLRNIYRKLGVNSTQQLMILFRDYIG